jgi:hypothetical protein
MPNFIYLKSDGALSGSGLEELFSAGGELLSAGLEDVSLGGDGLASSSLVGAGLLDLASDHGSLVGVEGDLGGGVAQGVALLGDHQGGAGLLGLEHGLHLVGVDDAGQVGVGHERSGQVEAGLELGALLVCAEDGVKLLEGALGPDDEAAQVATGGEVEQGQVVHQGELHAGQVAESSVHALGDIVDDERTASLGVSSVTGLASADTDLLGVSGLLDIVESANLLQNGLSILGQSHAVQGVGKHQRELRDVVDAVTTGHHEGGQGRGSKSRGNSVSALVHTDLLVPVAPDLGGTEHATTTAHVSESSLAGTGSTATGNARNTSNSAAGTPRLSRGLKTNEYKRKENKKTDI